MSHVHDRKHTRTHLRTFAQEEKLMKDGELKEGTAGAGNKGTEGARGEGSIKK